LAGGRVRWLTLACATGVVLLASSPPAQADLSFQPPENLRFLPGSSARVETVEIADVTGDSRDDLLVATGVFGNENEFSLFVMRQLADGSLSAPVRYETTGSRTEDWMGMAAGDFNADGRRDVAVATYQGVNLFFQTPGGLLDGPHFPEMVAGDRDSATAGYPQASRYLNAGDVDGDGLDDIVATTGQTEEGGSFCDGLAYLRQEASGGFTGIHLAADKCAAEVELGELNGDGRTDVIAGYLLFLQDPEGALQMQELPFGGTVEIADVSADGRDDAIFGWSGQNFGPRIRVLRQDSLGQLGDETSCTQTTYGWNPIEAADLDGDGLNDIVSGDEPGVFVQRTDGTFSERIPIGVMHASLHVDSVAVGDIDSNGRLDVVTAARDHVSIARQTDASGEVEPEPPACDNEAPVVKVETDSERLELDPEGFLPLSFGCVEAQRSGCSVSVVVRSNDPVFYEGAKRMVEFADTGFTLPSGEVTSVRLSPYFSDRVSIWRLLSDLRELPVTFEIETRDAKGNGETSEAQFVLASPTGYRRERRSLSAEADGRRVEATPGFYRCIPLADGGESCIDRRPRPLRSSGTLPVRPCDLITLRAGYPVLSARAVLEAANGQNLRKVSVTTTADPRTLIVTLPPNLPRAMARTHVFVRHRDMNRGDFELATEPVSSKCL
jgi:hypothetical protein